MGNHTLLMTIYQLVHKKKRRREKDIIATNDTKTGNNKAEITFARGTMMIQGETYKKRVVVPKPSELILIHPESLQTYLELPVDRGEEITLKQSVFTPYAARVKSHKDIRDLYIKLKLIQPSAKHIVCAYVLKGEPEYYNIDYCDDDEPGAGRQIIEFMKRQRIEDAVVFVARKYGGVKLGADRHLCYTQAASKALEACGFAINKELTYQQRPKPKRQTVPPHPPQRESEHNSYSQSFDEHQSVDTRSEIDRSQTENKHDSSQQETRYFQKTTSPNYIPLSKSKQRGSANWRGNSYGFQSNRGYGPRPYSYADYQFSKNIHRGHRQSLRGSRPWGHTRGNYYSQYDYAEY